MQPITNIRRLPQAESASGDDRVLVYCPSRQRTVTAPLAVVQAGIAQSVEWAAVKNPPATATRWPAVAEVDGLAAALGDKLDATSRYTDAEAVAAIQAAPEWHATNWDAAYGWGDHSLAGYLKSVSWGDVDDKPTFATVATSGAYSDLSGTPDPTDYATAAQGDKADSAVQPGDLGTAAATDATDYDPAGSAARAEARVRDTIRRTPDPLLMMMLS